MSVSSVARGGIAGPSTSLRTDAHEPRPAPLFDADGNCAFFLGGQINCSTTVHSYTDILRILSVSDDPNEDSASEAAQKANARAPPRSRKERFRSFWNMNSKDKLDVRETGMEQGLLKRIEKMSLATQMKLFYTAYSKVGAILCRPCSVRPGSSDRSRPGTDVIGSD